MEPRVFPILNCTDILNTRSFYEVVFGAQQVYQFPDGGDPVYLGVCIYVPDLDGVLEAAPASGGRLVVPATDTPWGERVAYVQDPEGTMLLVIQLQSEG